VVSGDGGRGLPEHRHTPSARSRPPACPGGDHIYKMDYGPLLAMHVSSGADVTVGCMPVPLSETSSFGIMEIDEHNRIRRFTENLPTVIPCRVTLIWPSPRWASMSSIPGTCSPDCSWMPTNRAQAMTLEKILSLRPSKTARSLLTCSARDNSATPAYWRDVGDIDSYWKTNMELISVNPELNIYDQRWPILTWQRQAPPAKFVLDEPGRRGEATNSMVAGAASCPAPLFATRYYPPTSPLARARPSRALCCWRR